MMKFSKLTRRDLLRAGMYGVGVTAGALPVPLFAQANAALAAQGGGLPRVRRRQRPDAAAESAG